VPQYLTLSLSDDRDLDLITAGEGPRAVVLQHGTPADASIWREWIDPVVARGCRFIAVSRPGYATSARHHGRTVADAATDIAEVLEHLGITEFVTVGWSGGGPHALATAALLPHARAVATLAGVGPYGAPDLDFLAGMGPENEEEFGAVLEGEAALAQWMNTNTPPFKTVTAAEVADAFGGLVPQIDKDCLNNGFAETMAASDRRALAYGWTGWADDDFAFAKPWGFELETLAAKGIPVTIWQGDLDLMVPEAHGEWLHQHIAGSTIRRVPGHGHISLVVDYKNDILDDLTSAFE
jgi:pimeloyl-ACP methyl ester carboxylesterase